MEKLNKISPEDLQAIHNAKANAAYMQVLAEKAAVEKLVAEMQVKNITLMAYLKYGLSSNDSIDNEGYIVRMNNEEQYVNVAAAQPTTQPTTQTTKKKK